VKSLTAGSEIDAWCTRCKMVLGHRIVALVRTEPARVICMTCGSEHRYKKAGPGTQSVTPVKRAADGAITQVGRVGDAPQPRAKKSASASGTKSAGTRSNDWEARVLGQSVNAFTRYSMTHSFAIGQLVTHPKFGDGYVLEIVDPRKVTVQFRDGQKTLAQGQTST
jgi:hypothetical protein